MVKLILVSNCMIFQACTRHDKEDVARGADDEEVNHMLHMNVYEDA